MSPSQDIRCESVLAVLDCARSARSWLPWAPIEVTEAVPVVSGYKASLRNRSRGFVAVSDQTRLSRLVATPAPLSILLAASDPDEAPNTTYAAKPMARASFFISDPL